MDTPQIPHFMPGGLGGVGKMTEEEEAQQDFKVSKYINEMDDELKDRFKALKAIQDYTKEFDEEESKQIREMEVEFEQKYKDVYRQRDAVVSGKEELNKELIEAFNKRAV